MICTNIIEIAENRPCHWQVVAKVVLESHYFVVSCFQAFAETKQIIMQLEEYFTKFSTRNKTSSLEKNPRAKTEDRWEKLKLKKD